MNKTSAIKRAVNKIASLFGTEVFFEPGGYFQLLEHGSAERKIKHTLSDDSLSRIINAYRAACIEQKKCDGLYLPNGAWAEDIESRKRIYLDILDRPHETDMRELLSNLFRNKCVSGLWTHGYYEDVKKMWSMQKKHFINSMMRDYYTWREFSMLPQRELASPGIGNNWGYYFPLAGVVSPPSFALNYYAERSRSLLSDNEEPTVAEIGGGYGGFAYYLMRYLPTAKYVDYDLPEILLVAAYFLMSCFPDKGICLYGEEERPGTTIALMPNFMLAKAGNKHFDLCINTRSLSEMSRGTINEYIFQIERITKKYFFHENSNAAITTGSGHVEIPSDNFPISNRFKRIYKHKSLWEGGSGRYMEYLYERKLGE